MLTVVAVRTDIDFLISSGCKCNLLSERPIRCVDIKEGFVSEFLALHIWIARSYVKVFVVVFGTNEPHAVTFINIARLLFVLFCPLRTAVTPVSTIGLFIFTPRVPDPYEFCTIAELYSVENCEGMTVSDTIVVLIMMISAACFANYRYHPAHVQLLVNPVPELP